jgi:hypothetical protein
MLTILVVITAATALGVLRLRASEQAQLARLGWMSQRWLDEHRAAQPS